VCVLGELEPAWIKAYMGKSPLICLLRRFSNKIMNNLLILLLNSVDEVAISNIIKFIIIIEKKSTCWHSQPIIEHILKEIP
jgi:hypothetical protein